MPTPDPFRFTLPWANPTTPEQEADNWRALDRWVNGGAPFFQEHIAVAGAPSSWTAEDPDHEPVNGANAPVAVFDKYLGVETVVKAHIWSSNGNDGTGALYTYALHFVGTTNAVDEYHDIAHGWSGASFVVGTQLIDGLPAGTYEVTLVVTTSAAGPATVSFTEFDDAGISLREAPPQRGTVLFG